MVIIELKKYYTIIKMATYIKIIFFVISFSLLFLSSAISEEKIKIGLLVPMTGPNKDIGQSIIKAVRLAVNDIDNDCSGPFWYFSSGYTKKTKYRSSDFFECICNNYNRCYRFCFIFRCGRLLLVIKNCQLI